MAHGDLTVCWQHFVRTKKSFDSQLIVVKFEFNFISQTIKNWTVYYCSFVVEMFIKNNSVIIKKHSFRLRFSINEIGRVQ